jgi:tetratricopeptide (TPR) repeat protein
LEEKNAFLVHAITTTNSTQGLFLSTRIIDTIRIYSLFCAEIWADAMAKTKPHDRSRRSKKGAKGNGDTRKKLSPAQLLLHATELLQTSQPEEALHCARKALELLQPDGEPGTKSLPALSIVGEICLELGDEEAAREYFTAAALLDPDGTIPEEAGGGADKFLWLAQICEEGGAESVRWFEKGATALKRDIEALENGAKNPEVAADIEDKKRKLANALCGCVEVYMTDLSWEEDAEARCEALVTEAMLVAPESPEVLQTLANVRISQSKFDDARSALSRSMELWTDLPPEDPKVPDFPTRISLARHLIESEMHDEAIEVLERLVTEDDSSVEAWYLGGWCLYLAAKARETQAGGASQAAGSSRALQKTSREWLQNSLKMIKMLDYEDDRLRDHAVELIGELDKILGPADDEEDEWEDDSGNDSDENMDGT